MRIVTVGSNGQVGSDLAHVLRDSHQDFVALTRSDVDITEKLIERQTWQAQS